MIASIASLSSGPSVSSTIRLPLPAASIITPMMLFALTLRPLRPSETSHWYLAASWVSFAAARACNPSLLMISTSCCRIDRIDFDVEHPVTTTADSLLDKRVHALTAVSKRPHQHRQIDTCDAFDASWRKQFACKIAGCRAEDVGEDQHPFAGVDRAHQLARLRQQRERV